MITFFTAFIVLAAIGMVAWPLLKGSQSKPGLVMDTRVGELLAQKDETLLAISELESDYNMGNLSQGDYRELRQKYEEKAVSILKAVDGLREEQALQGAASIDEEIEARVARLRAARESPVPDIDTKDEKLPPGKRGQKAAAKYCASCGARLEASDVPPSKLGGIKILLLLEHV